MNNIQVKGDIAAALSKAAVAPASTGDSGQFSSVLNSVTGKPVTAERSALPQREATRQNTPTADKTSDTAASPSADSTRSRATRQRDQNVDRDTRDGNDPQASRRQAADGNDAAVAQAGSDAGAPTETAALQSRDEHEVSAGPLMPDAAVELLLMMGMVQPAQTAALPATHSEGLPLDASATSDVASPGGVITGMPVVSPLASQPGTQVNVQANAQIASPAGADGKVVNSAIMLAAQDQSTTTATPLLMNDSRPAWLLKEASAGTTDFATLSSLLASQFAPAKSSETPIDARAADATTVAANMLAAINSLGAASGTQSIKDIANALQANQQTLTERVGTTAWTHELASKLVVLSKQEVSAATLYVTPAELGPVRIHIETQQNQANVWFAADHPDTRSAIENSLPRLREMFVAQGMQLNDAGVFGNARQQQQEASTPRWNPPVNDAEADMPDTVTVRTLALKLVDAYV